MASRIKSQSNLQGQLAGQQGVNIIKKGQSKSIRPESIQVACECYSAAF